mmetsp:Transcript_34368/g.68435  ORF Transcript_34368/g.68435 Transcript_34368/m.68435 type:complete len:234 (+) Transcript_34368:145-846(+)
MEVRKQANQLALAITLRRINRFSRANLHHASPHTMQTSPHRANRGALAWPSARSSEVDLATALTAQLLLDIVIPNRRMFHTAHLLLACHPRVNDLVPPLAVYGTLARLPIALAPVAVLVCIPILSWTLVSHRRQLILERTTRLRCLGQRWASTFLTCLLLLAATAAAPPAAAAAATARLLVVQLSRRRPLHTCSEKVNQKRVGLPGGGDPVRLRCLTHIVCLEVSIIQLGSKG